MSTLAHTVIPQASSPLTWHGLLTGSKDETIHERGFQASKHVEGTKPSAETSYPMVRHMAQGLAALV